MTAPSEQAGRSTEWHSWLPSYWLCHSEGYRVDSAEGRHVGFVEEVLWAPDESVVEGLLVRCCIDGGRTLIVPIGEVVEVRPEASSIMARIPSASPPRERLRATRA